MNEIKYFDASEFTIERLVSQKHDNRVYVVFSTFGEREADLIFDKISLLKDELVEFIDGFFLSHRRSDARIERTEIRAREADPDIRIIPCNSYKVPDMGDESGKGADMRRTLYAMNTEFFPGEDPSKIMAVFLDADVVADYFGSHFVMGLCGALLENYDFAKASFWRAMGRVKKYVAQPLFSMIQHPDLAPLGSLAYPLSGEVAGRLSFFNGVHFWQKYGVETGINIDAIAGDFKIADVNLGLYDHEHHGDLNIQKMSFGIIRTYLLQLLDMGIISLNRDAKISDVFSTAYIDEKGERDRIHVELKEKKYAPLCDLL